MSEWREFELHFITGEQTSVPERQKKKRYPGVIRQSASVPKQLYAIQYNWAWKDIGKSLEVSDREPKS